MGDCLSGCQNGRNGLFGGGCNSCIWILLILICCGGNGFGCGGDDNCSCIIWILLILCCCGGNNNNGNGCGCGCGC
jgi:hypothetical protein